MRILILFLLFLLFVSTLPGSAEADDVQSFTLKNGMKIFVLEDHSIPNANMYFFYRVGSRNERPGITGISHFFEHMMFNGARKYGPKEFDRVMEANGGSNNAYTSENVTVYTDWFTSGALPVIFDLEADRIANLDLNDKMVESERGVVLSERITGLENSSEELLHEQLKAVAFMAHPYRWPVIGYESDIKNWKKSDLQHYFDVYYAPNNCVVVLVGDLSLEVVQQLSEQYFGPIPANDPPPPVTTVEPEQLGEKRLYVKKDVPSAYLMIAYHVSETNSEDYYALELLEAILSQGKSSRLYSALIDEKQVAVEVDTYFPLSFDPNLFYITAVCSKDADETALEEAIDEEIAKITQDGVTEKELQKVINRKVVDFYREMETINGKAHTIGIYEIFFGDYRKLYSAPEEYKKVTAAGIRSAAARYLKKSNRTVGILKSEVEE